MSAETEVADIIATLDSSVRNGEEFEAGKTVVGGLYAIAAELANLTKQIKRIADGPEPFRGAR